MSSYKIKTWYTNDCLKLLTSKNIFFFLHIHTLHSNYIYCYYCDLCLTNLTIKNGSPNPELKYIANRAVNLYLLYISNGKLVPGPPYA